MDSTESNKSQYREHLVQARQKAYADFDKTVFALSGGALGISFAFIDKIIGDAPMLSPHLLQIAWFSWATSLTMVLVSFRTSTRALSNTSRWYSRSADSATTESSSRVAASAVSTPSSPTFWAIRWIPDSNNSVV